MVSLVDLAEMTREVKVKDKTIATVHGISAEALVNLLANVPELRLVFAERSLDGDAVTSLLRQSPIVLAQIIAAGLGKMGDAEAISEARALPAGISALLVKEIAECTFPQGLTNFLEGLSDVLGSVGVNVGGHTKAADGKSPEPSTLASGQDTHTTSSGDTPQGNSPDGQKS